MFRKVQCHFSGIPIHFSQLFLIICILKWVLEVRKLQAPLFFGSIPTTKYYCINDIQKIYIHAINLFDLLQLCITCINYIVYFLKFLLIDTDTTSTAVAQQLGQNFNNKVHTYVRMYNMIIVIYTFFVKYKILFRIISVTI